MNIVLDWLKANSGKIILVVVVLFVVLVVFVLFEVLIILVVDKGFVDHS